MGQENFRWRALCFQNAGNRGRTTDRPRESRLQYTPERAKEVNNELLNTSLTNASGTALLYITCT